MSVNPGFGGQASSSRRWTRSRARGRCSTRRARGAALEVDGGINRDTIGAVWRAGADTFVAGNAVFSASDPRAEMAALRARCADEA